MEKYDIGEHNIFNLVDLSNYSGVIVFPNTIKIEDARKLVIEKLKQTNIPVVSIEKELEGAYLIANDNYNDMKKMVNHVIKVHNCRDIGFITGPICNTESDDRFRGYKDALFENGIEYDEERVYFGSFCTWDGEAAVIKYIESGKGLPEAIVSSNDYMALGAYDELRRRDIEVPAQVLLTGYDTISRAEFNKVPITSVFRSLNIVGIKAIETLFDLMNGSKVEKRQMVASRMVFTSSCGCPEHTVKCNKLSINTPDSSNSAVNYLYTSSRMLEDLNSSLSLNKLLDKLKFWLGKIDYADFFLCMCDDWDDEDVEQIKGGDINYRVNGYSDIIIPVMSYINGEFIDYPPFKKEQLVPVPYKETDKTFYYIYHPLHFQDRCLGYCVFGSESFHHENNIEYTSYIINIINAFEIIRRENQLKILVEKLNRISISDALTGIYNRHGFMTKSQELLSQTSHIKGQALIAYFDLDGLKQINDTFGHEEGDVAIKALSDALNYSCRKKDLAGRLGGDEFAVLGIGYTNEDAEELCEKINTFLDEFNSTMQNPYTVSVSSGYYIFNLEEGMQLSDYIDIADGKMYKAKYEKKKKILIK